MRISFIIFLNLFIFFAKAQQIPDKNWKNLLIWGQLKSNNPLDHPTEIELGIIDSLENWDWKHLDSSKTIKSNEKKYSIYAHRVLYYGLPMHQYWDFYLDSTHKHFKILSDSLLQIFPKRPYKMRYTSEYRSLQTQINLLKKGKSKLPLSLHNFGFALDLGIYRGRKYIRRGNIYNLMGEKAKSIGLYWGGDFKGFSDPGHIQYFENSAQFIKTFPWTVFEFLPFKNHFEETYQTGIEKGKEANLQDTYELIKTIENLIPEVTKISKFAITMPQNKKLIQWFSEQSSNKTIYLFHEKEKWFLVQKGNLKYFWQIN